MMTIVILSVGHALMSTPAPMNKAAARYQCKINMNCNLITSFIPVTVFVNMFCISDMSVSQAGCCSDTVVETNRQNNNSNRKFVYLAQIF